MFKTQKATILFTIAGVSLSALVIFQNCSQARFSPNPDNFVLTTASLDDTQGNNIIGNDGDGGGNPTPTPTPEGTPGGDPSPNPSPTPDGSPGDNPSPTPTPESSPGSTPNPTPNITPTPGDSGGGGNPSDGRLVECQMIHPNRKVVLGREFKVASSNSSIHRVCMSAHACLKLVNSYAVIRDCTLAGGAPTSPANPDLQCTEIFPGTDGTCNNATILADDQVSTLLNFMGSN